MVVRQDVKVGLGVQNWVRLFKRHSERGGRIPMDRDAKGAEDAEGAGAGEESTKYEVVRTKYKGKSKKAKNEKG